MPPALTWGFVAVAALFTVVQTWLFWGGSVVGEEKRGGAWTEGGRVQCRADCVALPGGLANCAVMFVVTTLLYATSFCARC